MEKADLIQECPSCGQQGWVMPDMKPQLRHEHDCPHKLKERKMSDPYTPTDDLVEYFAGRKDLFTAYAALVRNGKRLEAKNADLKRRLSKLADAANDAVQEDLEGGVNWISHAMSVEFNRKYPKISEAIGAMCLADTDMEEGDDDDDE